MAPHQQPHRRGLVWMGLAVDPMAGTLQALGHQLLGLAGIEIHLEPPARGNLFQGELGANEVERAGGAP